MELSGAMRTANTPRRILVVDDEPLVCDTFKMLLAADGHQVETVRDGPATLAVLAQGTFDMVFIDYAMPGMKGDELAAAVRERWPTLPIVIVSASAEMLQARRQPLTGVDLIVGKPFSGEDLRNAIARVLSRA
jgi:CheY-like chemotaxis protein